MLRDAGGEAVSGEEMADELGVSRVAVAKHVASLRKTGYDIEAVVGEGYRLLAVPDAPLPAEVSQWLASEPWVRLEGGGETGSTNDDARALARGGAAEGTVVLASRQTYGRGRLGRTWESPEGGAYFSAVLRPQVAPSRVASLALAVALGVARGLESLGVASEVKWPNDVFAAGGKIAGVLLEMTAEADRVNWVVVGVGVNVRAPASRVPGAAYIDDIFDIPVARAVAAIIDGVVGAYADWSTGGFDSLREEYANRAMLTGKSVTVRDATGALRAEGVVAGIDDTGRLLVVSAEGIFPVEAGEVTLRP
jgi:BirA family biotin operon repressor/biotin-[acetyl-CoA-carboxylase] ligase